MKRDKTRKKLETLGVKNFETLREVERQQRDVLRQLTRSGLRLGRLNNCSSGSCGRRRCSDVCAFGTRSRLSKQIPAAYDLLKEQGSPFFEVRVSRGVWQRDKRQLGTISLMAARKLNSRAFDSLYSAGIVAVGSLKVSLLSTPHSSRWRLEIHQVVAGVSRDDLYRIFSTRRLDPENFIKIDQVKNLGDAIARVLRQDNLHVWQHPDDPLKPAQPNRRRRTEYYAWLLHLPCDGRVIRYGCDRNFNMLRKKSRVFKVRIPKERPDPVWLEPYQFGSDTRERRDRQ